MLVKKIENLAKSPGDHNYSPPIKEAIGSFNTNPHYLKLYHALNSAYINYKVFLLIIIILMSIEMFYYLLYQ